MVFQASRRQLLAHLVDYCDQCRAGDSHAITTLRAASPSPPPSLAAQSGGSEPAVPAGKHAPQDVPEAQLRKIDNLARAAHVADQEVKKMEFWSDVKDIARKGESVPAPGISGAHGVGNERVVLGGAAAGGKGKEKAVLR